MEWGREIKVDGVRPAWLADDVQIEWRKDGKWGPSSCSAYAHNWGPYVNRHDGDVSRTTAIRLPVDHFAYKALDAGFEPWGGGDAAPADWDGGEVLTRDGRLNDSCNRGSAGWKSGGMYGGAYVIGYRKRAEPASAPDTVTIKRMTGPEWLAYGGEHGIHGTLAPLRHFGLIREETRAERFTRETGHTLTDAVTAALEYDR